MKLIFLDIDGVLVTAASISRTGYVLRPGGRTHEHKIGVPEPHCIDNLNRLVEETGAAFVISSTWRVSRLRRMRKHLRDWGVKGDVIDVTPELAAEIKDGHYVDVPRGFEVKHWLDNTAHDIESFIAIDDDDDLQPFKDRLVWTDGAKGLTVADVDYAVELLQGASVHGHISASGWPRLKRAARKRLAVQRKNTSAPKSAPKGHC